MGPLHLGRVFRLRLGAKASLTAEKQNGTEDGGHSFFVVSFHPAAAVKLPLRQHSPRPKGFIRKK